MTPNPIILNTSSLDFEPLTGSGSTGITVVDVTTGTTITGVTILDINMPGGSVTNLGSGTVAVQEPISGAGGYYDINAYRDSGGTGTNGTLYAPLNATGDPTGSVFAPCEQIIAVHFIVPQGRTRYVALCFTDSGTHYGNPDKDQFWIAVYKDLGINNQYPGTLIADTGNIIVDATFVGGLTIPGWALIPSLGRVGGGWILGVP